MQQLHKILLYSSRFGFEIIYVLYLSIGVCVDHEIESKWFLLATRHEVFVVGHFFVSFFITATWMHSSEPKNQTQVRHFPNLLPDVIDSFRLKRKTRCIVRAFFFLFSFTLNLTTLITSDKGSGVSIGNLTEPVEYLYLENSFLKAIIALAVG